MITYCLKSAWNGSCDSFYFLPKKSVLDKIRCFAVRFSGRRSPKADRCSIKYYLNSRNKTGSSYLAPGQLEDSKNSKTGVCRVRKSVQQIQTARERRESDRHDGQQGQTELTLEVNSTDQAQFRTEVRGGDQTRVGSLVQPAMPEDNPQTRDEIRVNNGMSSSREVCCGKKKKTCIHGTNWAKERYEQNKKLD